MALDLDQGGRIPQTNSTYLGPSIGWILTDEPTDIEFVMDGAGATPLVGLRGFLIIPQWVRVNNWVLIADRAGNIVVDVWKLPLTQVTAGSIISSANSITGSEIPTLTNQSAKSSSSLAGWTKDITQNDVLAFNINSVSNLTQVSLILQCVRLLGTGQ